ncbi:MULTISPECIES: hypothetical protein [Aerococcus]|uniref:DUF1093 domain-containing protein n=2 Tax=Aerococcus tenax TaxID=3078812 RepID=A0A329PH47_9LACT|nr:hypothetical protein [Aerococcus urinae]MDL5184756.1 hypothetical protein [Aerococcus mictus]KAA9238588.1 hypothetical protein F6I34_08065 [Aerococcus urinae]MDK6371981.1 hypothetical protein [Aerococcus urinae]MDK7302421.1 hypothetical protein [Aerococcus urinae]MDK7802280.1 hypothetical protein [Aerococcus urinae]
MSFNKLKDPMFWFYLLTAVYLIAIIWGIILDQVKPLEVTGQPELVGQYDITGSGQVKRTLQIYRIKTNRGEELVSTEWRDSDGRNKD